MSKIPVLEIFGPTIQGEGRVIAVKPCLYELPVAIIVVVGVIQALLGTVALKKIFA